MNFLKPKTPKGNLFRDLAIIIFSILIAVILVKTGTLSGLLGKTGEFKILSGFIAGLFFTSIFTTAPATVALGEIAREGSLFWTVLSGGLGAMIGDLIIFRFVKNDLAQDFSFLIKHSAPKRLVKVFNMKFLRWLTAFLGALIIASPLPDELGLAMMGLTKVKTKIFIPLSFIFNSIGILIVGLVARAL
jgi:hypothetical protein